MMSTLVIEVKNCKSLFPTFYRQLRLPYGDRGLSVRKFNLGGNGRIPDSVKGQHGVPGENGGQRKRLRLFLHQVDFSAPPLPGTGHWRSPSGESGWPQRSSLRDLISEEIEGPANCLFILEQWFSSWGVGGCPQGACGDIFDCHGATGLSWGEFRKMTRHPTVHRTATPQWIIQPQMPVVRLLRNSVFEGSSRVTLGPLSPSLTQDLNRLFQTLSLNTNGWPFTFEESPTMKVRDENSHQPNKKNNLIWTKDWRKQRPRKTLKKKNYNCYNWAYHAILQHPANLQVSKLWPGVSYRRDFSQRSCYAGR